MGRITTIEDFGCYDVIQLGDTPSAKHVDYLDLLNKPTPGALKIDAVAEFQARPLLYIVSQNQAEIIQSQQIRNLQCLLANRGEKAYLGILRPGELTVYPINLDRSIIAKNNKETIKHNTSKAPLFFQQVINGTFILEGQPDAPDYVFNAIHNLISRSSETLIKKHNIDPLDVLSFLGRALFLRFLRDRGIIQTQEISSVCPHAKTLEDCFSNVTNSVATCQWLDDTFNGDLLPLSRDYITAFEVGEEQTKGKLFLHLQAILKGWTHISEDDSFQLTIDWGDLDFAHIPVGVLSQVYENFSRIWDGQQAEQTSVFYTPNNIAKYLVDDGFEGIPNKKEAHILDPSCGAGIFLVLAFRKLVATRWKEDGKRPNTQTIQNILYNQLCGFDISESALRLAALSLYITAIELNGAPHPPKSLKFPKPLKNKVLFNLRRTEEILFWEACAPTFQTNLTVDSTWSLATLHGAD